MTNKQRNLLTSVLFLAFGVFMFIQSQGVKHKIASDVGSGYVPAFQFESKYRRSDNLSGI